MFCVEFVEGMDYDDRHEVKEDEIGQENNGLLACVSARISST